MINAPAPPLGGSAGGEVGSAAACGWVAASVTAGAWVVAVAQAENSSPNKTQKVIHRSFMLFSSIYILPFVYTISIEYHPSRLLLSMYYVWVKRIPQSIPDIVDRHDEDRKSTRLNSSHGYISYAVFCLKKKKQTQRRLSRILSSAACLSSTRDGSR